MGSPSSSSSSSTFGPCGPDPERVVAACPRSLSIREPQPHLHEEAQAWSLWDTGRRLRAGEACAAGNSPSGEAPVSIPHARPCGPRAAWRPVPVLRGGRVAAQVSGQNLWLYSCCFSTAWLTVRGLTGFSGKNFRKF